MEETIMYRGWRIEKHLGARWKGIRKIKWTVYYPDDIRKITGHKAHDKNSLADAKAMINQKIAQYGTAKEYVATGEEWKAHTKEVAEKWDSEEKANELIESDVKPTMSPFILVAIFIGTLGYLLFRKG